MSCVLRCQACSGPCTLLPLSAWSNHCSPAFIVWAFGGNEGVEWGPVGEGEEDTHLVARVPGAQAAAPGARRAGSVTHGWRAPVQSNSSGGDPTATLPLAALVDEPSCK